MIEWRNDTPPIDGYYEVMFGDDEPMVVYLHPHASGFISWGWDESDDPEAVTVNCGRDDFLWREVAA